MERKGKPLLTTRSKKKQGLTILPTPELKKNQEQVTAPVTDLNRKQSIQR